MRKIIVKDVSWWESYKVPVHVQKPVLGHRTKATEPIMDAILIEREHQMSWRDSVNRELKLRRAQRRYFEPWEDD